MKALARHFLLAALLLRALVPAGWMPNPQGVARAAFVLCTMDGAVHAPGKPSPANDAQHHDECPFAAAPHLAKTPDLAALPLPSLRAERTQLAVAAAQFVTPARYQPQSPRAPPAIA